MEEGQPIGRYQILSAIGEGGMGVVYLAEDTVLQRKVALKLLPITAATDKGRLGRFEREARAASALNHPNILTVHEFGQENGIYFLATELVEGKTLREEMRERVFPLAEALQLTEQIALGLSAAHDAAIIHRDIKPENIMIRRDRIVKILDFGLAKLVERPEPNPDDVGGDLKTDPGTILGTVSYMSPEQAAGNCLIARPTSGVSVWSFTKCSHAGFLSREQPTATLSSVYLLTNPNPSRRSPAIYLPDYKTSSIAPFRRIRKIVIRRSRKCCTTCRSCNTRIASRGWWNRPHLH